MGVLKLMFKTPIVTTTENVTRIIVKRRYLPEKKRNSISIQPGTTIMPRTIGSRGYLMTAVEGSIRGNAIVIMEC